MSEPVPSKILYTRRRIEVNTDPQRRCYNGCHASSELRWFPIILLLGLLSGFDRYGG